MIEAEMHHQVPLPQLIIELNSQALGMLVKTSTMLRQVRATPAFLGNCGLKALKKLLINMPFIFHA